jgi:opacity protein-like surface antigen
MKRILGALALMAFAGQAHAQTMSEMRPYFGAGIGYTMRDNGLEDTTGTDDVEKEAGFKGLVGLQLNKYFGVEGFYTNFGQASLTGTTGDTFRLNGTTRTFAGPGKVSVSGWSIGAAANAGYPVHDLFNPYVKLGFHRWDGEVDIQSVGGRRTASDNGVDLMFGGGIQANITNNISLRGEFERFNVADEDVNMISASLVYRF